MAAAVNCFVMEPIRNLVVGALGMFHYTEGFVKEDFISTRDEHATHKLFGAHVGLNDLVHARGIGGRILRKASGREASGKEGAGNETGAEFH
jgi:hypothetical protein